MTYHYIIKVCSLLGFFLIGCTSFNTPFIDVDDVLKLKDGLTIEQTKSILGKPLIVKSGDNTSNEIIWIYEVRTIEVMSGKSSIGDPIPNKSHSITKYGDPIHYLTIHFIDNKVSSWESYSSQDKSDGTDGSETSNENDGGDLAQKNEAIDDDVDDDASLSESKKKLKSKKNLNYSLRATAALGEYENASFGLRFEKKIQEKFHIGILAGMHDWGAGMWYGLYAVRPIITKRVVKFSQVAGISNWGRYEYSKYYVESEWGDYWEYGDYEYHDSFGLMLEERFDFLTPINGLNIDLNIGVVTGSNGGIYLGSGIAYSF